MTICQDFSKNLYILIDDPRFVYACLDIDIADEKRYFVVFVQSSPNSIGKFIDTAADFHRRRLAFIARKRTAVTHISVDVTAVPAFGSEYAKV